MSKISEQKEKMKYYMNKYEKNTAHCLVYIVTNIKFKIQNRSHEMKNITTANKRYTLLHNE